MRVFITGATGFVGLHVTNRLLENGHKVYAGGRNLEKIRAMFGPRVDPVSIDFSDAGSIGKALWSLKPDVVVNLIGIISEAPAKGITFEDVQFRISKDLYDACRMTGVGKVIHMSALGVHPDAPSRYHKTKLKAEQALQASGLTYCIFRPSVIIGPEQKLFSDIKKVVHIIPIVALPAGGGQMIQPVDVRDVSCAFAAAVDRNETDNKIYELCGPVAISFRKMIESISQIWNKRFVFFNVPMRAMTWAAGIIERMMEAPPLSSDLMLMIWKDNICGIYGGAYVNGVEAVCGRTPIPFHDSMRWALLA
ncbi:MAG TPA: NAD-dependent epimerase/dehydratase family protein [Dissulfurispiraceae bacterium]|nr:NAD-dependent epimerase/dehydratase family protein [Dissulfurispiraceae bacterium]